MKLEKIRQNSKTSMLLCLHKAKFVFKCYKTTKISVYTTERIFSENTWFTKSLWILDSLYIMPRWEPWGYKCLYKSVVAELLTHLRNSINLHSCCSKRLISFPCSTVISLKTVIYVHPTKVLSFSSYNLPH